MEDEHHNKKSRRTDDASSPTSPQEDHKQEELPVNQTSSPTNQNDPPESQTALATTVPFATQRALSSSHTSNISSHPDPILSACPVPHLLPEQLTSSVELPTGSLLCQPHFFPDRFSFSSRHVPLAPAMSSPSAMLFYTSSPDTVLPPAAPLEWYPPANTRCASGSDVALQPDVSRGFHQYVPDLHQPQSRQSFFTSHVPQPPNVHWRPPSIASYLDLKPPQLLPGASEPTQMHLHHPEAVFTSSAGVGRHLFLISSQLQDVQYFIPRQTLDNQSVNFVSTEGQNQDLVISRDYDLPNANTEDIFPCTSNTVSKPVYTSSLRAESAEFIPKTVHQHRQGTRGQLQPTVAPHSSLQNHSSQAPLSPEVNSVSYTRALKQMESYAQKILQPDVEKRIVRIPATYFNEQKLEEMAARSYMLLGMPQTPALRGQEALSRVCCSLEVLLRLRGSLAVIISNYKYKECYLRRAPNNVFPLPSSEGSHDILMFGVEIGIICIQVTCVEKGTSKGTVKKQVRDTMKQLRKDEDTVCLLLRDLNLQNLKIVKVLALPNLSRKELRQKLETRMLRKLMSTFGCGENLEGIITSDHLPSQGCRHFPDMASHDLLQQWLDETAQRGTALPIHACEQMFARYTGEWSAPEVWTQEKPRVEVRTLLDAALETARRYGLRVLTQEQEAILNTPRNHVIVVGVAGSGTTLLLQLKVTQWLNRGAHVVIFIPRHLEGLRQVYAKTELFQDHSNKVLLWNGDGPKAGTELTNLLCTSLAGEEMNVARLQGEVSAVFDGVDLDISLVTFAVERATVLFQSVWMATSRPLEVSIRSHVYHQVRLSKVTRIPTSIQALFRHGLQADCDGTTEGESSAAKAASFSLASGHTSNVSASDQASLSVTACEPLLSAPAARNTEDEMRSYLEASSEHGLACDGPSPMMIFHPTHCPQHSRVVDCSLCCRKLARVLQELGQLDPFFTTGKKTERGETAATAATRVHDDKDEESSDEDERDKSGLRPCSPLDAVVFTDTAEDGARLAHSLQQHGVLKEQFLRSMRALPDLPHVVGTEKALVVYAGQVRASRGGVLHALVSRLRDVMSLCQGQLVLVLEVQWLPQTIHDVPGIGTGQRSRMKPFELELQLSIAESEKEHLADGHATNVGSQSHPDHQH